MKMTAVCSDDHWTLNANGTMRTPLAQRIAKCSQVKPAVDIILRAGNTVRQGALLRGVLDKPSMFSAQKMRGYWLVEGVSSRKICRGAISEDDGAESQHVKAAWKYHH